MPADARPYTTLLHVSRAAAKWFALFAALFFAVQAEFPPAAVYLLLAIFWQGEQR